MGEDVAGCVAGSVVVVGEGTAGKSEALGALSSGVSSKGASLDGPYPSRGYASSTPMSTVCFSLSFSLPSGPRTDRPLKAAPKPSRESSLSPLKGTKGTSSSGSGSPAGSGAGAGLAGATEGAVVSAVSFVFQFCISSPLNGVSLDILVVLHWVAGTQRPKNSATKRLKQAFTVDCFDDIGLLMSLLAPAAS